MKSICCESQVGDFSVSLKAPGRNKHFRVQVEGSLYCIGQRKFNTLDQLVAHYQRAPIYTNKQGEKLYLVRPLPRAAQNCWAASALPPTYPRALLHDSFVAPDTGDAPYVPDAQADESTVCE